MALELVVERIMLAPAQDTEFGRKVQAGDALLARDGQDLPVEVGLIDGGPCFRSL